VYKSIRPRQLAGFTELVAVNQVRQNSGNVPQILRAAYLGVRPRKIETWI